MPPRERRSCYCPRCNGVLVGHRTFYNHQAAAATAAATATQAANPVSTSVAHAPTSTGSLSASTHVALTHAAHNDSLVETDSEEEDTDGDRMDEDDGFGGPTPRDSNNGNNQQVGNGSQSQRDGWRGDEEDEDMSDLSHREPSEESSEDPSEIEGLDYSDEEDEYDDEEEVEEDPEDNSNNEPDTAGDLEPSDDEALSSIEIIRITQQFIEEISSATYATCKLDAKTIERLENPVYDISALDDPDIKLSLKLFLTSMKASEEVYSEIRKAVMERHPDTKILSYYLVKKLAADITGVTSISDDMCVNSCLAFTGPFKEHDHCATCGEARFDSRGKPRKQACTIPLGPLIQALRISEHGAEAMRYRDRKTAEIIDELNKSGVPTYDDIFCGEAFLDLHEELELTEDDTTVALSIDGAQLYQNKKSDTWVAVWIVFDYDPKTRYRKKRCLPAAIIPGPNKPKNIDSFLFRSIQNLSALQRANNKRGLRVYDALKDEVVYSRIIFLLGTADALGLTELDGRVGHHGCLGCRIGCPMKGRHKQNSGHYCAAHLRPHNPDRANSHADYDFRTPGAIGAFRDTPETYKEKLTRLSGSSDEQTYKANRKETGLSKPSILSGLVSEYMLPVPMCFTLDIMHLFLLNLAPLFISHWRGTLPCDTASDDRTTWPWVVLTGDTWTRHGKMVMDATKYFPSSFHRTPRNPCEKINSGYKATEFYLYVFALGPAFFRPLLPEQYWRNFCKLVFGVRTIVQRKITEKQLTDAHALLGEFVREYEELYYQCRTDRLHFCRPAIHTLLHCGPETARIGILAAVSQYTLEGIIGLLVASINQPSGIFANLIQITIKRAQASALISMCPSLDKQKSLPQYCHKLKDGSALLQPRTRYSVDITTAEENAIAKTLEGPLRLRKWGRLLLSNGQIARSLFAEDLRNAENKRNSRNVKIRDGNLYAYAEVQFYFLKENEETLALEAYAVISQYSEPNAALLSESYNTLWVCSYLGEENLKVISTAEIVSVVSMQPLPRTPEDGDRELWFVAEKSGLDDMDIEGRLGLDEQENN